MCVTLSCAWLFALSYMLAIVHSEYHELNKDVKKCKYTKTGTSTTELFAISQNQLNLTAVILLCSMFM